MKEESVSDLTLEGLVHDLSNVFETINEAAELLHTDPKWVRLAKTLERSVHHGRNLVSSYRESAMGPLEFHAVLDGAVTFVADFLQLAHGPKIEFHCVCDSNILLEGSSADWERVLVNLLMNAVQAMKDGGTIEISARNEGGGVRITIADTGPGIAPEILQKIFEPHFSTKGSRGGLGLHIVESIVKKYGGIVQATNRPAVAGAAISIFLPAAWQS